MKPIKKLKATISSIKELSPTAREVSLKLSEPMPFIAGSFVNVFMDCHGKVLRRAFSISSNDKEHNKINLSIRLNPEGAMTPVFWGKNIVGTEVELMGPLGLNTADKMKSDKIFLFGFGVGAGVVKSVAEHFVDSEKLTSLTIVTGSRSEVEILHKDYFDSLKTLSEKITVEYVVSRPKTDSPYHSGYIQEYLGNYDFSYSDVYVCGQEDACNSLVEIIRSLQPPGCTFSIEGFH